MLNLSIISVIYNHPNFDIWLHKTLSLFAYLRYFNIELILVNTNSEKQYDISQYVPDYDIQLLTTDQNIGYCGGNNYGISHSKYDNIIILNPDVYIKESIVFDWLYTSCNMHFGISGMYRDGINWLTYPTMFPIDRKYENEELPFTYNENPNLNPNLNSIEWKSLPFIDGCLMSFKREIFDKVQFDENIFPGYFGENAFQFKCQLEFGSKFELSSVPIDNFITHDTNSDSLYGVVNKITWTKESRQYFYNTYALPNYEFFLEKLV